MRPAVFKNSGLNTLGMLDYFSRSVKGFNRSIEKYPQVMVSVKWHALTDLLQLL